MTGGGDPRRIGREAPIEFFFWSGCPSHERALAMLRDEMAQIGLAESLVRVIDVETDDLAVAHGIPGSPTIRVAGADVQDPGEAPTGLTCRLYRHRDGRPSPLPDRDDLRDALFRLVESGGSPTLPGGRPDDRPYD